MVTTPSPVRFSRSQVIFGAAKYGSSGSPVSSASRAAEPGQPLAHPGRPPVLPDDRRGQRRAGPPVPGEHGLALVGQRDRVRRGPRRGQRLRPGPDHRLVQLLRVGLHAVGADGAHPDRHLAGPEHLLPGTDEQRLGRRGALVDREDVHRLRLARHLPGRAGRR